MSKKLSQIFLSDNNIIQKIITACGDISKQHIVEIGCGNGILTEALYRLAQSLAVFEIDESCIEATKKRLPEAADIQWVPGDVLKADFSKLKTPYRIVANLPYHISAKLIKLFIDLRGNFSDAIVMVQSEFADKLSAKAGDSDYTSFTLYANFYLEFEPLFKVSKNSFFPVPKVDSKVICITAREKPQFLVNEELFFNMIRTAFWGRRKPLKSALAKGPYIHLDKAFKEADFFKTHPDVRGERLSINDFHQLFLEIEPFILE